MRLRGVLSVAVATVVLTTTAAISDSGVARADVLTDPVRHVPLELGTDEFGNPSVFEGTRSFSENGRYATIVVDGADTLHVDLTTGGTTPVTLGQARPSEDGASVTGVNENSEPMREDLATGTITDIVEIEVDIGLDSALYGPAIVVDTDVSGRYQLLAATTTDNFRTSLFVYDTSNEELVTPIDGLPKPVGDERAYNAGFSDDGTVLRYSTDCCVGATAFTLATLDLATGDATFVAPPVEQEVSAGGLSVSANFEWQLFPAKESAIAGGSDDTVRLYRRNLASGNTVAVPADWADLASGGRFQVFNDGRVLMETAPASGGPQIVGWDGTAAETVLLSRRVDGDPAVFGVQGSYWTPDGSTIAFVSFDNEMVDGLEAQANQRFLFTIGLEPTSAVSLPTENGATRLINTRDTSAVAPLAELCVAVVGAEPGDFVGVNVTPVDATTGGFGTMHSSDVSAGSTSNVNFGPGTVDPNLAFVLVGADGEICFTNSKQGAVNVIIDQLITVEAGTFRAPSTTGALRLIDTRRTRPVEPSDKVCVTAARARVGEFVGLNVTPVDAVVAGFGVIHSSDDPAGATSNVNFGPGTVDPNVAFAKVGADGQVCFTNSKQGAVHVIIDEFVIASGDTFTLPSDDGADRLVDTRESAPVAALATTCVAAVGASPGDYIAVNVTPVDATTGGFGVIHSSDDPAGATSNVNFGPGTIDPNVAFVQVGVDGDICFTNSRHGAVNVIIDQLVTTPNG